MIQIRAISVTDNGNGTFDIELPTRELSNTERDTIRKLYPNLTEKAYELLAQEELLSALATPEDVQKEPDNQQRIKRRSTKQSSSNTAEVARGGKADYK